MHFSGTLVLVGSMCLLGQKQSQSAGALELQRSLGKELWGPPGETGCRARTSAYWKVMDNHDSRSLPWSLHSHLLHWHPQVVISRLFPIIGMKTWPSPGSSDASHHLLQASYKAIILSKCVPPCIPMTCLHKPE